LAADSVKLLLALARQGNRGLALERFDALTRGLGADERRALYQRLRAEPVRAGAIFVPLVDAQRPNESIACEVRVEPDEWSPRWTSETRESARAAIALAARLTGAAEPLDGLVARLELAELLEAEVSGGSLYLATLLAAVARFGEKQPLRNVLATGAFDEPIAWLPAKLELCARVRGELKTRALQVASSEAPATLP
jgi:hypothetical protein